MTADLHFRGRGPVAPSSGETQGCPEELTLVRQQNPVKMPSSKEIVSGLQRCMSPNRSEAFTHAKVNPSMQVTWLGHDA